MTTARHWDDLYGRPSLSWDGILLAVAILLHTPLLFLRMKAPPPVPDIDESVVKIENIDQLIQSVKKMPIRPISMPGGGGVVINPPKPPPVPYDLRKLLVRMPAPVIPVPTGNISGVRPVRSPGGPVISPGAPVSIVGLNPGLPGGVGPAGVTPTTTVGKTFNAKSGAIVGIGTGAGVQTPGIKQGGPSVVTLPTTMGGTAEAGLVGVTPLQSRPNLTSLPPGNSSGRPAALVDQKGGVAPSVPLKPVTDTVDPSLLPMVEYKPREGASLKAVQSEFPIYGPLANRKINYSEPPEYPESRRKAGIEAKVVLRFTVTPNGKVKDNVIVLQGSGFDDLDRAAAEALLRWVFDKLPEGSRQEQVGDITMTFSLK